MITVQVPPGVQEGHLVQVVDPNTNQPFQVQVPAGLQPGQIFNCALPTSPVAPGQIASTAAVTLPPAPGGRLLKEKLANVRGRLRLGLPSGNSVKVSDASGVAVCTINYTAASATLSLPDGSDSQVLHGDSSLQLNGTGTGGPGDVDFVIGPGGCDFGKCCGFQAMTTELREGNNSIVSLNLPPHPWMCPFLILTGCVGCFCTSCVSCCLDEPAYLIELRGKTCGEVRMVTGMHHPCGSVMSNDTWDIIAEDPTVIHGTLLCLARSYMIETFHMRGV